MNDRIPSRYTGKNGSKKWIVILFAVLLLGALVTLYVLGLVDLTAKSPAKEPQGQLNMEPPSDTVAPDDVPDTPDTANEPGTGTDLKNPPPAGQNSLRPAPLLFELVGIDKIAGYAAPAGNNGVAIVLKNQDGIYAADTLGADALKTAIAALKAKGLYVIGAVYTFRDDAAVRANIDCGIHYDKETVWLDGDMKRWLNPYVEKARTLALQSIASVCEYGVDEVMLLECNFPSSGLHSKINYLGADTVPKEQVLKEFLTTAASQIKASGKAVSVAIPTGKTDATRPENTGVGFDQKSCGADAVYSLDKKLTFTAQ